MLKLSSKRCIVFMKKRIPLYKEITVTNPFNTQCHNLVNWFDLNEMGVQMWNLVLVTKYSFMKDV